MMAQTKKIDDIAYVIRNEKLLCIKKWLLILISLLGLSACERSVEEMHYGQKYLLIAQQENLINYNLDTQQTQCQSQSRFDKNHINRNQFTVSRNNVYMPYESGLIAALDIASGQILWEKEVDPMCNQSYAMDESEGARDIYRPLLMSQATINNNMLYISSTSASSPCLYAFDANTGEKLQASELPSRYNLYAPVANQYGVFTNGAIYLSAFASKPYLALYPKGQLTFYTPLYAPLQL